MDVDPASFEGSWKLNGGDGPEGDVYPEQAGGITLEIADGRIQGRSACNSYRGSVTITRGADFEISDLSMTERACAPEVMRIEARYIAALQTVDYIREGRQRVSLFGTDRDGNLQAFLTFVSA